MALLERGFRSGSGGFAPAEVSAEVRGKGHLSPHHPAPGPAAQLLPTALGAAELPERKGRSVRGDCTQRTSR